MAKKKAGRRKKRSPEEMIADLQQKIEEVKERAAAREAKVSPAMKRTVSLMRNISKAMDEAAAEKNGPLRHALADAHKGLATFLQSQGLNPPKTRMPRGRRPS